jgi:hypothetical protein
MNKSKLQIALDFIIIALFIIGASYIYFNWDWIKYLMGQDVCKVCQIKTEAICSKLDFIKP